MQMSASEASSQARSPQADGAASLGSPYSDASMRSCSSSSPQKQYIDLSMGSPRLATPPRRSSLLPHAQPKVR